MVIAMKYSQNNCSQTYEDSCQKMIMASLVLIGFAQMLNFASLIYNSYHSGEYAKRPKENSRPQNQIPSQTLNIGAHGLPPSAN
jgi:hypothetical protein